MSRTEKAKAIRSAALAMIERDGIDRICGKFRSRMLFVGGYEVSHIKLGYAGDILDIWPVNANKIFSMRASPDGRRFDITTFKRGDWEATFEADQRAKASG